MHDPDSGIADFTIAGNSISGAICFPGRGMLKVLMVVIVLHHRAEDTMSLPWDNPS
jgi:hypothetical protein